MPGWTNTDIDTLARTLFGEARGSSSDDRTAVAWVILNRARIAREFVAVRSPARTRHPLFGSGTIESACKAPWQFSCWLESDPNRAKLLAADLSDPAYLRCMLHAAAVVLGEQPAPFPPSTTHYFARSMQTPPPWARGLTPVYQTPEHSYFNDVP